MALQCDLISFKGAERHHVLLFTFSTAMLLALFHYIGYALLEFRFKICNLKLNVAKHYHIP